IQVDGGEQIGEAPAILLEGEPDDAGGVGMPAQLGLPGTTPDQDEPGPGAALDLLPRIEEHLDPLLPRVPPCKEGDAPFRNAETAAELGRTSPPSGMEVPDIDAERYPHDIGDPMLRELALQI